jgi:outer membrane lipoprotein-sorting protein
MLAIYLTMSLAFLASSACLGHAAGLAEDDPLQVTMNRLSGAECCRFEFVAILESDVFDSIDSTTGTALIGADDRYDIRLGPDRYLRTDEFLYSYSGENEQVTLERVESAAAIGEAISFITNLDRYYQIIASTSSPGTYLLNRHPGSNSTLPKVIVLTTTESGEIDRLVYVDDNGDTNRIVIATTSVQLVCDSAAFVPDFPETTEIIKLY